LINSFGKGTRITEVKTVALKVSRHTDAVRALTVAFYE